MTFDHMLDMLFLVPEPLPGGGWDYYSTSSPRGSQPGQAQGYYGPEWDVIYPVGVMPPPAGDSEAPPIAIVGTAPVDGAGA
jgi:hypothetical protein